ncbi:hypothetical protein BV25DRAFT_1818511 [Artomyces pyxidatus]|uniref:Uncharacterized protein n=1 Tax=Artomyces pyxidatus TaxID=48021 RepID=A0ACB8TID4_9AGAM|nr:hypothetical protein BV25DRAFT_1818511 [Artomyces pyxidatus]
MAAVLSQPSAYLPLHERLLCAETTFLQAATHGRDAIKSFQQDWSDLTVSVLEADTNGLLHDDTAQLAHEIGLRMQVLAQCLLDTTILSEELGSNFTRELNSSFSEDLAPSYPTSSFADASMSSSRSPLPSSPSSPEHDTFEEEDVIPPAPVAGHKRRSLDDLPSTPSNADIRPSKRTRPSYASVTLAPPHPPSTEFHPDEIPRLATNIPRSPRLPPSPHLPPSPRPLVSDAIVNPTQPTPIVPQSELIDAHDTTRSSLSRKRRLSFPEGPAKRLCPLNLSPRRQTVSTPMQNLSFDPVGSPDPLPHFVSQDVDIAFHSNWIPMSVGSSAHRPPVPGITAHATQSDLEAMTSLGFDFTGMKSNPDFDDDILRSLDDLAQLFQLPTVQSPLPPSRSPSPFREAPPNHQPDLLITPQEIDWSFIDDFMQSTCPSLTPNASMTDLSLSPSFPSSPSDVCLSLAPLASHGIAPPGEADIASRGLWIGHDVSDGITWSSLCDVFG